MMVFAGVELLIFFFFGLGGQAGVPLGLPPGPEDPALSRFAPAECLFYTSWSPTATADADSANVTERWLAQPEIRDSFGKLKAAIREVATRSDDPDEQAFGKVAFTIADRCLSQAAGFYVSEVRVNEDGPVVEGGALIHLGGDAGEINGELSRLITILFGQENITVDPVQVAGNPFHQIAVDQRSLKIRFTWGVVDEQYLAVTVGDGEMERLLANLGSAPPTWLNDLRSEHDVPRVSNVTFIDLERGIEILQDVIALDGGAEPAERALEVLGMKPLRSAGWIAGLDDQAFICRGSIRVEGEPSGILAIFGDEGLESDHLGRIADDRMLLTGASLSPSRVFELIRDISNINEFSRGEFDQAVLALNTALDINLEEDILQKLGQHAYVYGSVNFTNPTAGWVLAAGVSNEMELAETHSKVVEFVKNACEESDEVEFSQSEVNGNLIYSVTDNSEWSFMPDFSWSVAEGEVLISMDKSSLRRHLRREPMAHDALVNNEWFSRCFDPPQMDAEGPMVVASLNLSSLLQLGMPLLGTFGEGMFPPDFGFAVDDFPPVENLVREMQPNLSAWYRTPQGFSMVQRQTYPGGTPGTLVAATVVGLMPASMTVRRAAARTTSMNNIRQLVLAMHNYHDANRALPARFSKNGEDQPLLSWRVHILPYLEEAELYSEFHLDEPWDSEHNKTLIARMPMFLQHPRIPLEEGKTLYMVPAGEGSIMKDPEAADRPVGMRLEDVTDGTSQTAIILEASQENAVIWTKPDDFNWQDHEDPVAALFGESTDDGINIALADGSVQYMSREKLTRIFRQLVQAADGEVVEIRGDD